MKKIILFISLIFCGIVSNAQSYYVATKTELYTYNFNTEEWELRQNNPDVNIIVVMEEEFLTIEANSPTMYKIFKDTGKDIGTKSFTGYRYKSIDLKKNDICSMDVVKFGDSSYMISIIKGTDYNLRYYIKTK